MSSGRKRRWGIVIAVLLLCIIASAGNAAPFVIILIIGAGISLLSYLSARSDTNHSPSEFEETRISVTPAETRRDDPIQKTTPSVSVSPATTLSIEKNPYRYEESKHIRKNITAGTIKTAVKPMEEVVEEPKRNAAYPIEIRDSGLIRGMGIGEMEWIHLEKGHIAEDEIPKQEFFASIEEAKQEYDIPEEYIRIMIETNSDGTIKECPALLWKDNFFVNILPLIKKSTISCWSIKKFKEATYKVLSEVDPDSRYNGIGMSNIASEFEDRFPEYTFDGLNGTYTSVFVFQSGIEITNTSAKEMFELLEPKFVLNDNVSSSEEYADEIKEIYKAHILWKNEIIDEQKYDECKENCIKQLKERERTEEAVAEQRGFAEELGIML